MNMKEPLESVRKKSFRLPLDVVQTLDHHANEFDENETDIVIKALREYLDPAREARRRAVKEDLNRQHKPWRGKIDDTI